jgi:hypothetical protein
MTPTSLLPSTLIPGDYDLDRGNFAATERLLARRPNAQIWLLRAGHPTAYRIVCFSVSDITPWL